MNPLGQLGTRVAAQLAVASPATTTAATATRAGSRSSVSHSHSARPLSTATAARTAIARKQPRSESLKRTQGQKLPFAFPAQSRSGIHSAAWSRNIGGEGQARSFMGLSASVGLSSAPGRMPVGSVSRALALVHPRFHSTHRVAHDTSSSFSE